MELRVRRAVATVNIMMFRVKPARRAPTAAMPILKAINFFAPSLSDRSPAGIVNKAWRREGIATMTPICWFVRVNSSLITGKMPAWMLPATWVRVWVMVMTSRLKLRMFPCLLLESFFNRS